MRIQTKETLLRVATVAALACTAAVVFLPVSTMADAPRFTPAGAAQFDATPFPIIPRSIRLG